ncbi:MAG: hypothetical protein J0I92_21620 [Phyllobacterium sp.]|nr:hypothetical protein [Phyllobacterium sp.]
MSAFGKAFAAARRSGKSTFSFGGKSYNTKVAATTPKKGPVPTARPDATKTASTSKAPQRSGVGKAINAMANSSSTGGYSIKQPAKRPVQGPPASAKAPQGLDAIPKLSIASRIAQSVRVGQRAVDRGARRDAAETNNPNSGSTFQKMLDGMNSKKTPAPKKRK